ncbi:hypothetical protein ANTQUA_LOCUS2707 [Anthophora quadrimaculata]
MVDDTAESIRDLINHMQSQIRSLQALGRSWENIANDLLVSIAIAKMSAGTKRDWEQTLSDTTMPKIADIFRHLRNASHRSRTENAQTNVPVTNPNRASAATDTPPRQAPARTSASFSRNTPTSPRKPSSPRMARKYAYIAASQSGCKICNSGSHPAYRCRKFLDMAVEDRLQAVRKANLCINCLDGDHATGKCSGGKCRRTGQPTRRRQGISFVSDGKTNGILTTAVINVLDNNRQPIQCRTLVDTCSNANFITEDLAKRLRLPSTRASVAIQGLNRVNTVAHRAVSTTIKSRLSNYERSLTFYTIPRISERIPDVPLDRSQLRIPPNIHLADPQFHQPGEIDMLIGTGPALSCLSVGQIDLSDRSGRDLILQKTQLGWIIGGNIPTTAKRHNRKAFVANLDFNLQRFWEVEEGPQDRHLSPEERECEEHFAKSVRRDNSGRYVVALPFNERKDELGESRSRALTRLLSIERKLERNPELKRQYTAVMDEYRALGHMSQVEPLDARGFYLPHHAVIKPSSATTKVRVVFDGSAKTSSGVSLNDALMTGPTIQDDLFKLLVRFRVYAYVITGDIEKMYRQFLVRPDDRAYQRILWRDEKGIVQTFELNVVTFGLSSAPFLAIRCVHQLADDECDAYPEAAAILKRDLYVDDLLTGANTVEEARHIQSQVGQLLRRGGLNIRQWASNEPALLKGLSEDQIHPKILGDDTTMKALGVSWDARNDAIRYVVEIPVNNQISKRNILSTIAKIFDPLGLLGPVTIIAKILMQRLWQLKIDWDESLPASLYTEWTNYAAQLQDLNDLEFSRCVTSRSYERFELHGFCDSSERAYGACLYVRTIDEVGRIETHLLCAKSRVAPLKTNTLARLELCGAVLLASLYASVRRAIPTEAHGTFLWTDSTIVLNWINTQPCMLKTFVANRVADIQGKTEINTWRHIKSEDNPADLISRGVMPAQFARNALWRHGPDWFATDQTEWPSSKYTVSSEIPEARKLTCLVNSTVRSDEILTRYSCIKKLTRIVAYCLRFRYRAAGPLTVAEMQRAEQRITKMVQSAAFHKDIKDLEAGRLHPKSQLRSLAPFLDDQGLLRVGGRLQKSELPYTQKHPIVLPKGNHVTDLIIRETHVRHHHAGITATLCNVRQAYWPIDGRNTTRKIIRRCVRCFRMNPPAVDYTMGNLPATRVTAARPFYNCGVDYCGPFYVKERRFRNRARVKIYVAVFTCFATKAVHLEVAGDLTTEAFIAALKRFIARRGICRNIYSDNATNFVGADNELTALYRSLSKDERLRRFVTDKAISWHFIPALSPHFGGLWEAAVKSFKHHVKRVVGDELFTLEQFTTFAIEVEAILNSRPLTPLSADPNDPSALTPGHFLIGDSLTSVTEIDFSGTPTNRLSTWQHIQKVKQHFWARWHKEYINHLNERRKWITGSHHIREGTIVVLKEDNLPPLTWHLGRVEATHPGADGVIRAVTVRTSHGTYRRNVRQLAPLPDPEST